MKIATINTIDAKEDFLDIVNRVAQNKERIMLSRRGKDIAAIIPIEDFKLLETNQDRVDVRDATESLKEARERGTITLQQLLETVEI